MSSITMNGLTKVYPGDVKALDALDLAIEDGEFFALLGPSGCGKTTLLRTIAGLENATGGSVAIGGRDVTALPPGERDVAMVFQDYALFPHMTVTENIAYPLRLRRVDKRERAEKARRTARALGLGELGERRPAQLSGGQQQRVALARAMAYQPQAFLFDEPLSNLDARMRIEARTFLKKLQHELGITTVFVTHDQAEALAMADRIAVMDDGRVQQVGTPTDIFRRPVNTFVASFIGSTAMNLLPVEVRGGAARFGAATLPLPPGTRVEDGQEALYGIRPEYFSCSDQPLENAISGTVTIVESLGSAQLVTLETDGGEVQAIVPEDREPVPGGTLWAAPRRDRVLLYRDGDLVGSDGAPEASERVCA